MYQRQSRAFTLIEVLVVVAIIALLISILMPSLARAREQVRGTICKTSQKQIMTAQLVYLTEFKKMPATLSVFYLNSVLRAVPNCWPPIREPNLGKTNWVWDGVMGGSTSGSYGFAPANHKNPEFIADAPKRGTLFKFLRDAKVYLCPSDREGAPSQTDPLGGGGNGRTSYSMTAHLGYKQPENLSGRVKTNGTWRTRRWGAAEVFCFVEENPGFNKSYNLEGNFNVSDKIVARHGVIGGGGLTGRSPAKGRTNIAYLDGHVESPLMSVDTDGYKLFGKIGWPLEDTTKGTVGYEFLSSFIAPISPKGPF